MGFVDLLVSYGYLCIMENQIASRRWTGRSTDVKIDAVGRVGGEQWEVSFSDRGIRPSKSNPITCEKFKVSRAKVESLIISLSTADRNGKKVCEQEYREQWNELRRGGVSEKLTVAGAKGVRGLGDR